MNQTRDTHQTRPPEPGPEPAPRLAADLVDADHPAVQAFARENARGANDRERAVTLYYAVRDGFRYDPYCVDLRPQGMRASVSVGSRKAPRPDTS